MRITDHRLEGVKFIPSPNTGAEQTPSLVVMHYTAAATFQSTVAWFTNPLAEASAHFVIDPRGAITQFVPCNVSAWHAGVSEYRGRKRVNSFSIEIELVNPGRLTTPVDWHYGYLIQEFGPGKQAFWPLYPDAQISSAISLVRALAASYPLTDIVGHEEVAVTYDADKTPRLGRKTDPGIAFPWKRFWDVARTMGVRSGTAA